MKCYYRNPRNTGGDYVGAGKDGNGKKIVFPSFNFDNGNMNINCPVGYIAWADLHKIYENDCPLQANLRKAHQISYHSLHPCNNKQDVLLSLFIFNESTIAVISSYFPEREEDMSSFLATFQKWWTANSEERYSPNPIFTVQANERQKIFSQFARSFKLLNEF